MRASFFKCLKEKIDKNNLLMILSRNQGWKYLVHGSAFAKKIGFLALLGRSKNNLKNWCAYYATYRREQKANFDTNLRFFRVAVPQCCHAMKRVPKTTPREYKEFCEFDGLVHYVKNVAIPAKWWRRWRRRWRRRRKRRRRSTTVRRKANAKVFITQRHEMFIPSFHWQ